MKRLSIAVLPGDGIGTEVMAEAVKCLQAVEKQVQDTVYTLEEHSAGAGEYLRSGNPLPDRTMEACRQADAILLGAMGLPDVRLPGGTEIAPQLDLREQLDLYAGVRPIRLYNRTHSPLRGYESGEIDLVLFRENTEGMFYSRKQRADFSAAEVCDTLRVSRQATERICRSAFEMAARRRGKVTLVDKANVLPSMAYFRSIFDQVAAGFPQVEIERIYVDASALYLVQQPRRFDVLVMENLFGDILSDLAAGLVGGMGMAPSGDIGDQRAMFQPSHGSAPDIAGKGIANPVATILSSAMMLDWLGTEGTRQGARLIYDAVERVCADPANATRDLGGTLSTTEMGDRIVQAILESAS
jgi:3-isopropylmalate dehydrogenase